jgi:hypothetical protein
MLDTRLTIKMICIALASSMSSVLALMPETVDWQVRAALAACAAFFGSIAAFLDKGVANLERKYNGEQAEQEQAEPLSEPIEL